MTETTQTVDEQTVTETAPRARGRRGRFTDVSLEDLKQRYTAVVGRASSSDNRAYLIWRIREAEKGRLKPGPRAARAKAETTPTRIVPLRLTTELLARIDAECARDQIPSRTEFLRRVIDAYLPAPAPAGA